MDSDRLLNMYVSQEHYLDHLLPVWDNLPKAIKGKFYCAPYLEERLVERGLDVLASPVDDTEWTGDYILLAGYSDIQFVRVLNERTKIIHLDHGVGFAFPHPAYAGYDEKRMPGYRKDVALFLAANDTVAEFIQRGTPNVPCVVVGTPKMDRYASAQPAGAEKRGRVAISFHWTQRDFPVPEASTALPVYDKFIYQLDRDRNILDLVGHSHPRARGQMMAIYRREGVRVFEPNLFNIFDNGGVFLADATSAQYEAIAAGLSVVFLNHPNWDRTVDYGTRFWRWTNCGLHVWSPGDMLNAVRATIDDPFMFLRERKQVRDALYPHIGKSVVRTVHVISEFVMRDLVYSE